MSSAVPGFDDDVVQPIAADLLYRHPSLVEAVLDTVTVPLIACDASGRVTLSNAAAKAMFTQGDRTVPTAEWIDRFRLFRPDGVTPLPLDEVPILRALREGVVTDAEIVVGRDDAPEQVVRCDGRALLGRHGEVVGAVVAMTDVTASRRAEQQLRVAHEALARSEAQFRTAFERGPTPMCRLGLDGAVAQLNPALRRLLARPTSAILGHRLATLIVPADRERAEVALAAAASPDLDVDLVEVRFRRPDGSDVWCELAVSCAEEPDGTGCLLVQIADIDARKRREEDLERRALCDDLTGLPNRAALLRVLAERLAPAARPPAPGLLYLDLDGFKAINDELGHGVGDEVLIEVGRRLRAAVRPDDVVARLSGDEFVVVVDAPDDVVRSELTQRLHATLHTPIETSAGPRVVKASIGSGDAALGEDPGAVLARADSSMYASKARRRPEAAALHRRPGRAPVLQPRIAELLATAEAEGRLDLHYQPVVHLDSRWPVGVEALLRMRTRSGNTVRPDAFVPVAEATGDIHALGDWVLRQTCAQAAQWKAGLAPGAEFSVGVNLSPRQLDDPHLLTRVDAALAESGLDPASLVLEITERLLTADTDDVRRTLRGVRDRGVHLACDDFGSGYASLRYLDELPLDIIKIDRSWTARLAQGGSSARLARGVLRLASTTELTVVVEGVETEQEREALLAEGCRLGQGYLFARPMPPDELATAFAYRVVPTQREDRASTTCS